MPGPARPFPDDRGAEDWGSRAECPGGKAAREVRGNAGRAEGGDCKALPAIGELKLNAFIDARAALAGLKDPGADAAPVARKEYDAAKAAGEEKALLVAREVQRMRRIKLAPPLIK